MRNDPVSLVLLYNRQCCTAHGTVLPVRTASFWVFPSPAYPRALRPPLLRGPNYGAFSG